MNNENDKIEIRYYLKNEIFAARHSHCIPRIGDEVRFERICYKIIKVVWIEDGSFQMVAIDIKEIES